MIKRVTIGIDFKNLINRIKQKDLLTRNQRQHIADTIAVESQKMILDNKVEPKINSATKDIRRRIYNNEDTTTLLNTGNLVDSIVGTPDGVEMAAYGKYQHNGFKLRQNAFTEKLNIPTPQFVGPFEFIATDQGVDEQIIDDITDEIIRLITTK